ncbi:MAG: T9SS type A sorting domain-containing protein [Cytophagaceae bacterium]|nr:T9SS type A sorting domain-containing protein [Cytophagaceae bacterium]
MRQHLKKWGVCLFAALLALPALAQIRVNFPTSRAVFQRGNNGRGTFSIAGNYYQPVDQIQARVIPIQGGSVTDWTTIQANPQQGNFLGTLNVAGGWYRLEVRGVLGGNQVGVPATVEKMGVGEVFILSGQSNAQGIDNLIPPGQIDPEDRVNTINYDNSKPGAESLNDPPFPEFTKMRPGNYYSLRGMGSWAWGWLGNQIASRFNVPVLFINSAYGGTHIDAWRASAAGQRANNIFCQSCADPFYPNGMPYGNLRLALNYYGSLLGVRSVLWMLGETDNFFLRTGTNEYREALKFVINQSRNDAGKNISWVVAQTSLAGATLSSPAILEAQAQVAQQVPNVFPGPATDNIQNPRLDGGVHFSTDIVPGTGKSGHQLHAEAWNNALTDAFFATSQPQSPAGLQPVAIACNGNSGYTLTISGNQPSWSNGQTGSSISVGRGLYYGRVRDGSGNILLTQPVFVPQPTINPKSATEFCQGGSVTLEADAVGGVNWSNGANTQSISATTSGTYTVSFRDQNGCTLNNSVAVTVNPLPNKPRIAALSDTVFCQGGTVVLRSVDNVSYAWSTGANTRDITVATSGRFQVSVIDAKGCRSPASDQLSVRVNPNPVKPTISAGGPTTFCADESVLLTSTASDSANYVWSPNPVGVRTRSIRINQTGAYSVRTYNRFGCVSVPSDPVSVRVNALPPRPLVAVSGPLDFCQGVGSVTLCTNNPLQTAWTEASDSLVVLANTACFVAKETGRYRVRITDANGCKNFSIASVVNAKPRPGKPLVERIGTYTLRAEGTPPGQAYRWVLNSKDTLSSKYYTQIIKTPSEGVYTAIARITYTDVRPALTCFSDPSERTDASVVIFPDNAGLSVYPNPSLDGNLTIETQENWEGAFVSIWTLSGQLLFQEQVNVFDERKFVRMGPQPGLFLLRVKSDRFNVTKRILVRP